MRLPCFINFHQNIGRLMPLLPRMGKAPRIERNDVIIIINDRNMRMSEHHDIRALGLRHAFDIRKPGLNLVVVSMRKKYLIISDQYHFFPLQSGKKIAVSGNDLERTASQFRNIILASLRVSEVDQKIDRLLSLQRDFKILMFSVGITYDQYFHAMLPFSELLSWHAVLFPCGSLHFSFPPTILP